MKKPEILSYIAIVLSVIAIVMCSFCCMGCKKGKMRHRGPQAEMVMQGEHMRPDMRNNKPGQQHQANQPGQKHPGNQPGEKHPGNQPGANQPRQ